MRIKLFPIIILVTLFIAGCAGMQVNWNVDKQATGEVAACEAGYQLAKHFPDEARVAYKYAKNALDSEELTDFNEQFKIWRDYALEKAGLDRHYKRQLDKFMPEIKIPETPTPEWVDKVKPYLQEFIYGIEDELESPITKYLDIFETNYLEFVVARGLRIQ